MRDGKNVNKVLTFPPGMCPPSSGNCLVLEQQHVDLSPISAQLSSTSDLGLKGRNSKTSVTEMQSQHDNNPYGPTTRAALPSITAEQPVSNYSGEHMGRLLCILKSTHNVHCSYANINFSRDKMKLLE